MLVLASDGVWDHVSSQEVPKCKGTIDATPKMFCFRVRRAAKPMLASMLALQAVDIAGKFEDPKAAAREITGPAGKSSAQNAQCHARSRSQHFIVSSLQALHGTVGRLQLRARCLMTSRQWLSPCCNHWSWLAGFALVRRCVLLHHERL